MTGNLSWKGKDGKKQLPNEVEEQPPVEPFNPENYCIRCGRTFYIEADEPPTLRNLDFMCQNCRAEYTLQVQNEKAARGRLIYKCSQCNLDISGMQIQMEEHLNFAARRFICVPNASSRPSRRQLERPAAMTSSQNWAPVAWARFICLASKYISNGGYQEVET